MINQISYAADKIKNSWQYLETILPATYNELNDVVMKLVTNNNNIMSTVLAAVYPVGSIYLSTNAASPADLFGGTWVQLKDRFLLGAGDTYPNGATGGEANHTLTIDETPSHAHTNSIPYSNESGIGNPWGSGGTGTEGWYSFTTGYAGGGQAHNNMPPYLAVYMWKRTA